MNKIRQKVKYTISRPLDNDGKLYYFYPKIILNDKKIYKIKINGFKIDMDEEFMKDVRERNDWKPDDVYIIASLLPYDMIVYYR